jgi:hypothetical protein
MTGRVLAVLFFALLLACNDKPKVPDDVIPPQQMGEIIADITLAEAWVENYVPEKANKPRDSAIGREVDKVLALHQVKQDRFRRSYEYYKTNPPLFKEMLDSIFHTKQLFQQRILNAKKPAAAGTGATPPPGVKKIPVQ